MALYLVESILNGAVKDKESFEKKFQIFKKLSARKMQVLSKFKFQKTFQELFSFSKVKREIL